MIKHTLEIAQRPAHISLRHRQLILRLDGETAERTYACEDIGVLVLQHPAISLSAAILDALLGAGAVVIICNKKHLPSGLLLPTLSHTELVPRMMNQLNAGQPARKQVWKGIVQAKIMAQAHQLENPQRKRLTILSENVKSGDPENAEAQAAKIYWPAMFPDRYGAGDSRDFESESLFNVMLNYGYAIIRAATARALVSAGLQPALGVFHHRRNNPFCLADDVMEPLRPLIDQTVKSLLQKQLEASPCELTPEHRREMLSLLTYQVDFTGTSGPLMSVLPRYIASFYRMLTRESSHLDYPTY